MDATHLSPDERAKLRGIVNSHRMALHKLRERMKARSWYSVEPAFISIGVAIDALRAAGLVIDLAEKLPPGKYPEPLQGVVTPIPMLAIEHPIDRTAGIIRKRRRRKSDAP